MILGVGVDLCDIGRMEKLLKTDAFLKRYFAPEEAAYIRGRGAVMASSLAGLFAAKEAFVKALGQGFREIPLSDIIITHTDQGAPYYAPIGRAREALAGRGIVHCHLSISHEGGMAVALCVMED